MPTSFTVVPVKDGRREGKEGDVEEDVDDNNALREEDEDLPGERAVRFFLPSAGGL